ASRPAIIINNVLLPQPLGPRRQTNSPFSTENVAAVIASNAVNPLPKTLRTRWQLISACMRAVLMPYSEVSCTSACSYALHPIAWGLVLLSRPHSCCRMFRLSGAQGPSAPPHTASPPSPARRSWPSRNNPLHVPLIRGLP